MASSQPNPDGERLAGWSHLVDGVLHDLLPVHTRVALVNFPNHANAGDSAIWLGALASLQRMQVNVVYRASWATYEPSALRRALGDGVVLLQGGGNFGDLYPANQQATRERVLTDLSDLRTIQLPQSLHFDDPANLEQMRRLCEGHGDFTLLVREEQSLAFAKEHFAVPIELCPDLALALEPHHRVADPRVDVLHLARVDKEAVPREDAPYGAGVTGERVDWLDDLDDEPRWSLGDRWRRRLNRTLLNRSAKSPGFARNTWKDSAMTFEPLARRWVGRADEILARGRVVRTDRLHAHVLSLLQGIPHVIEDNATGKVRSFHDTWTHACSLTHWADSPADAAEMATAPGRTGPLTLVGTLPAVLRSLRRRSARPTDRRFRLFGVGLAKSGTHSLAGVFARDYRSAHEPEAKAQVELTCDVIEGKADAADLRRYLRDREDRLRLEVNAAGWNGLVVEELVDLADDTRFVVTVREPRSWLDSLVNHLKVGQAPEHFLRLRRLIYDTGGPHPPGEAVLAEHGFYPLDGYLGDWARRHQRILDAVPAERLLVVRTEEIGARLGELAAFVGVDPETLDPEQAHGFKARAKFGLIDEIDQDHLNERIDTLCGPVLARLFPDPAS